MITIEKGWIVHRYIRRKNVAREFKTPTEAQIFADRFGARAYVESVERDIFPDAPDFPGPWRRVVEEKRSTNREG